METGIKNTGNNADGMCSDIIGFKEKMNSMAQLVNKALDELVPEIDAPEAEIYKAMRYSLLAGGKRLRPILALAVCELLGGDKNDIMPYGCAIEMIHTYSLIHDDLPAMDNDDFRRGKPTNHKMFGEAIAILAGDALLNKAFEVMLAHTASMNNSLSDRIEAMRIIAESSGTAGMISGQVVDLMSEGKRIEPAVLEYMHKRKTAALIQAPVLAAAVLCKAGPDEYSKLKEFSENIGLAFQIKDDIMDVEGSFEAMGKTAGSDEANNKSTFVSVYGLDKSKEMLKDSVCKAVEALDFFGEKALFLKRLAEYIESRSN